MPDLSNRISLGSRLYALRTFPSIKTICFVAKKHNIRRGKGGKGLFGAQHGHHSLALLHLYFQDKQNNQDVKLPRPQILLSAPQLLRWIAKVSHCSIIALFDNAIRDVGSTTLKTV